MDDKDLQANRVKAAKAAADFLSQAKYDSSSDEEKLSQVLKEAVQLFMEDKMDGWTVSEIGAQMETNPSLQKSDVKEAVYALSELGYSLANEPQRVGEIKQTLHTVIGK